MTIKAYFQYKEQDATLYWNTTNAGIRVKGILEGTGEVSSVAGQLRVEVAPFKIQTYDGMTVVSDATETITVTDDEIYYIVLYAKYQLYTAPTLTLQAITSATYTAHPEKDYLVSFVRLVIPPAAIQVLPADYDGSVRDGLTPLQRDAWKEAVDTFASLPTDEQEVKDGDTRVTLDNHTAWVYNSALSAWESLSATSTLENLGGRQAEYFANWNRSSNGDGIVGGNDRYGTYNSPLTTDYKLSIHDHSNIADTIGIGMIHAVVNGHRVDTLHEDYALTTPKPAVGTRYDLVYLEVWREEVLNPETEVHAVYGGGTDTFGNIRSDLEDLLINSNEVAGANADINQITTTDDNRFVRTNWRIFDLDDVDSSNIGNPHYEVDNAGIKPKNIDGNDFARPLYGTFKGNVWYAASTTAYDNFSWAIPLLVVQRTSIENFLTNTAIQIIRSDGYRYVWDVYPTTEIDSAARTISMSHMNNATKKGDEAASILASGFLNYLDLDIGTDTVTLPQDSRIYVDGYEYTTDNDMVATLPDAPIPPIDSRKDFVYIEMVRAVTPDERPVSETTTQAYTSFDAYRGYVSYQYQFSLLVEDVGSATTAVSAMASAGFAYVSPGLYRKITMYDDRKPVDYTVYAIPVSLVHRLNQDGWDRATNPNGGGAGGGPPPGPVPGAVVDGDMELPGMVNWTEAPLLGQFGKFSGFPPAPHGGLQSLQCAGSGAVSDCDSDPFVGLIDSGTYDLIFWAATPFASPPINVRIWDGAGWQAPVAIVVGPAWTQITMPFTKLAGSAAYMQIQVPGFGGEDTYIDDVTINSTGGGGIPRPDGRDWHDISANDLLDSRHKVVLPGDDLKGLLDESQQKLLTGKLRTRMVDHPTWGDVSGTGLLEQTGIAVAGTPGTRKLPADPDNLRYVWSDASEYVVFGESFPANVPYAGTYVTWSGPPAIGVAATLTIAAPDGAYILTGTDTNPIFATQDYAILPANLDGPLISDSSNGNNFFDFDPNVVVWVDTSTDAAGEPIARSITTAWSGGVYEIDPAAGDARLHVYYWICYNKSENLDGQGNIYNDLNQGLEHTPNEVILAENLGAGNDPAIGPLARDMSYVNHSGPSLQILNTDIATAYPEFTGTISIYGVALVTASGRGEMYPNTEAGATSRQISISLSDTYTDITITPTVAFLSENIKVIVLFEDSNQDTWFDFRQHTNSLMGPLAWSVQGPWVPIVTDGATLIELPVGHMALSLDQVIKEGARFPGVPDDAWDRPGNRAGNALVYWRNAAAPPGTPWEITNWIGGAVGAEPDMRVGGLNTHVFTFMLRTVPAIPLNKEFLFVFPVVTPAGAADDYLFTTEYTPYQGLNASTVPELETTLHGVCVASGDPAVTTRGTNDPRIQVLDEDAGYVVAGVSDDPQRSLDVHKTNDTYCLLQSWRPDYSEQRNTVGNVADRLPILDPSVFAIVYSFFSENSNWGLPCSLKYAAIAEGTPTDINPTDMSAIAALPSVTAFTLDPQFPPTTSTSLLKTGSVIKWPDGIAPGTITNLQAEGFVQGTRGWSVKLDLYSIVDGSVGILPVDTAAFLPGGTPEKWNKLLNEIGVAYEEAPQFSCMGVSTTVQLDAASLGYHCALISPSSKPGVLQLQATVSPNIKTALSAAPFNAVGNTFDSFVPYRNLIINWNLS